MLVLQCQVRCETAAQPGSFSRAKSACHESWRGCGPRARPRWSLLGYGCASLAAVVRLCPSQATKMLACEHLSAVFLWCLVACEMRVAVSQNVAVVGWGPAVNPLCQCVSNACPRRGALCLALDPCCDDCLILLLLYRQCLRFTGIRLVFDPFLILFGLVWYGGLRKWSGRPLLICPLGGVGDCVLKC